VLDVLERARVEVVYADDSVSFRKQEIAQVRAQKARTAGDGSDRHRIDVTGDLPESSDDLTESER
jgi:hypothetical protein